MGTFWVAGTLRLPRRAAVDRAHEHAQTLDRPGLPVEPGEVDRGREPLPGDRLGAGELLEPVRRRGSGRSRSRRRRRRAATASPAKESTALTAVIPERIRRAISIAAGAWRRPSSRGRTGGVGPLDRLVHVAHPGRPSRSARRSPPAPPAGPRARRPGRSAARTAARTASAPPSTARPPRASASSMCRRMTSSWLGIVIGPIGASRPRPRSACRPCSISVATNSS